MIAKIAKPAAFALAGMACAIMAMPQSAAAQSYGYPSYSQNSGFYDPCMRDQRERQASSGLLGAAIGAIAGSQMASRGRRTEGSLLGGVLGAAVGAGVGRSTAACTPRYDTVPPYPVGYDAPPPPPAPVYDRRYDDRYDDYRYPQDYDQGYAKPAPSRDECQLAQSEIRLPDGRIETRYVRPCRDENGRYRVVD